MSNIAKHIRHGNSAVRPYLYGPVDLPEFLRKTFVRCRGRGTSAGGQTLDRVSLCVR